MVGDLCHYLTNDRPDAFSHSFTEHPSDIFGWIMSHSLAEEAESPAPSALGHPAGQKD